MKTLAAALLAATLPLVLMQPAQASAQTAEAATASAHFSMEVVGEGPDIILLPGLATPRAVWQPTAERLAVTHRVHLLQVRGFGEDAGANATGPVLEPLVADLATYIRREGLEAPALVGHSLGGLAALMLASGHPDLPGKVMVVDALPWFGALMMPGADASVAMIEPRAAQMRDAVAATYGSEPSEAALSQQIGGQVLDEANLPLLREWARAADPRVTATLLYEDMVTDLRQDIARIEAPVTVLYPFNDGFPTEAMAGAFYPAQYAALPATHFVAIGQSGHFVMLDRPGEFAEALDAFLAD